MQYLLEILFRTTSSQNELIDFERIRVGTIGCSAGIVEIEYLLVQACKTSIPPTVGMVMTMKPTRERKLIGNRLEPFSVFIRNQHRRPVGINIT